MLDFLQQTRFAAARTGTVLQRIKSSGDIFWAQSDRDWILDGAAVHVSMVGFATKGKHSYSLDGIEVNDLIADLTSRADLTLAQSLPENEGLAFIGDMKKGQFDIDECCCPGHATRISNPNGRPNSDVIKPWINGLDITERPRNMWIIDFGVNTAKMDAAQYERPFEYVRENVKPARDSVRNP